MKNPFKRVLREYLKFSRADRNAILILSTLILIALVFKFIISNLEPKPFGNIAEYEKIWQSLQQENVAKEHPDQLLFSFNPNIISNGQLDSLNIPSSVKKNLINYRKAGGKFNQSSDFRKLYGMNDSIFVILEPFIEIPKKTVRLKPVEIESKKGFEGYFDPNTTVLEELKNFGFNDFQAGNLLSYKEKGGIFRKPLDLLKIYGIDSTFFCTIENNIKINEIESVEKRIDTFSVVPIELNNADSIQLIMLEGIGPTYATRILKYRELLGGYYSKEQLAEVYNITEETLNKINPAIVVDSLLIKRIRINFAEYKELVRHPYLNKVQVKAIISYREKNGAFENLKTIQYLKEFTEDEYQKITPYFTCR